MGWYRTAAVFVSLLAWVSPLLADTQNVETKPGLIELRISVPEGADVSWEARQPLNLSYRTYEAGSVCVFCCHASGQLVVVSDVIDWDARKRDKTTWVVTVSGDGPAPEPDPPGPGPGPDPDPGPNPQPTPADVPNKFGLGDLSYQAAIAVGNKGEAAKLSAAFLKTAQQLHEARITTATASQQVIEARESLSAGWEAWEQVVQPKFTEVVLANGSGQLDYRDYFREIGVSLEVAAR